MSTEFSNIAILGGGLLGGSLALTLGREPTSRPVRLWARRPETVRQARERGISGATQLLDEAVAGCDLLVLAVPVGVMPALLEQALAAGLPAGCLVTDVGSVKMAPHQSLRPLLAGRGMAFIGSHPMAGSERDGLSAAAADLFDGAACLLTNDELVSKQQANALERFWQRVGCRTSWLTATEHDALVARISHLPHVLAAVAARVCLANVDEGKFGGGGLRDTTRVAAGNAEMWAEILTENRRALVGPLQAAIDDLRELLGHLEAGAQEPARQWLATAKHQRDLLHPPS